MVLLDDTTGLLPARRRPQTGLGLRLTLVGRAAVIMFTSMLGLTLFPLWLVFVVISPLTIVAWLVLPTTAVVRGFANANRRSAATVLGERIDPPYRPAGTGTWLSRTWAVVRERASWRDALWLPLHAVAGFVTAVLQVALFLGGLFYLIYPFLFWVTPPQVFRRPFGDWHEIHSVAASFQVMPLALVSFLLWWVTAVPLSRAEASVNRTLLR